MENIERLEEIDVVRKEGNEIHVLGRSPSYYWGNYLQRIVHDASTGKIIRESHFKENAPFNLDVAGIFTLFFGIGLPFLIYQLTPKVCARARKTTAYDNLKNKFMDRNMKELEEAVKDIKVYQGSASDISKRLGKEIEYVNTGKSEEFIKADDSFWLRVKAYTLGANAVINYQPGSSIGTPVKIQK